MTVTEELPINLIRQLEDERYAAMLGRNLPALDRLLDSQLVYVHSSGASDTKESFLRNLLTGAVDYLRIDREERQIQVQGDTAVVLSSLSIDVSIQEVRRSVNASALAVWVNRPTGWCLLALHAGTAPATV